MPDKKLIALVVLLIALSLGHDADHIARGDIHWQLLPIVFFFAKYAFLGLGLFFTLKNKLGPLFWAITAGLGVALGWLAHFSPFTDQDSAVYFSCVRNTRRRFSGGGLARRAHARTHHYRCLCRIPLGQRATPLAPFFRP